MAKKQNKPTNEAVEMEKSDEVLTVVDSKKQAKAEKAVKADKSKADKAKQSKKKAKNEKQKRNYGKEVISELKKVSWPSFKQVCKQTGTVLVVVAVFMLAVLGIDTLVSWILQLITKI